MYLLSPVKFHGDSPAGMSDRILLQILLFLNLEGNEPGCEECLERLTTELITQLESAGSPSITLLEQDEIIEEIIRFYIA